MENLAISLSWWWQTRHSLGIPDYVLREQKNHSPVHADDFSSGRYFSNGEVGER